MIPARKFPLGQRLVAQYIERSLRKQFDVVYLRERAPRTEEQRALPLLLCANHSSWWDGYVALVVERALGLDAYLMMEEAQLRRYFFFSWVGCFSVNRQDVRSALQTLQYAGRLLKERAGRMVWLFPQGEIVPNDRRPLVFFNGAAYLARLAAPIVVSPVAIRLEFLREQHPALFISLGEPLSVSQEETHAPGFLKTWTQRLEERVVAGRLADFRAVLRGGASTNRIFDKVLLRKQIDR